MGRLFSVYGSVLFDYVLRFGVFHSAPKFGEGTFELVAGGVDGLYGGDQFQFGFGDFEPGLVNGGAREQRHVSGDE
jgi:hypothetical protein